MPARLFTFVQMELPWELGPADGRYLLRKPVGPEGNEPQHVVVLSTVGAERRGLLGGRSRTRRTDAEPARVPVARATIVDPVPLSARQPGTQVARATRPRARGACRRERAQPGAVGTPHRRRRPPHPRGLPRPGTRDQGRLSARASRSPTGCGPTRASCSSRAGGPGGGRACCARRSAWRCCCPGAASALLCEELVLRARLDLDAGRLALAAIELERAYAAALAELPAEERTDLRERIEELRELRAEVERVRARGTCPGTHRRSTTESRTRQRPTRRHRERRSCPSDAERGRGAQRTDRTSRARAPGGGAARTHRPRL